MVISVIIWLKERQLERFRESYVDAMIIAILLDIAVKYAHAEALIIANAFFP
jgi:hypothetical protein